MVFFLETDKMTTWSDITNSKDLSRAELQVSLSLCVFARSCARVYVFKLKISLEIDDSIII